MCDTCHMFQVQVFVERFKVHALVYVLVLNLLRVEEKKLRNMNVMD